MIRYTDEYIERLLSRFMAGESSLEEEAQLADYFRSHDVRPEWEDYRAMFAYFDDGMDKPVAAYKPKPRRYLSRRLAIAACAAVICGFAVVFFRMANVSTQMARVEKVVADSVRQETDEPARVKPELLKPEPPKTVTAKADKPAKSRKKPSRICVSPTIEPDKDVEEAKEELRQTQREIEETYREIAEALNETARANAEIQTAQAEIATIVDEAMYESPRARSKNPLMIQ